MHLDAAKHFFGVYYWLKIAVPVYARALYCSKLHCCTMVYSCTPGMIPKRTKCGAWPRVKREPLVVGYETLYIPKKMYTCDGIVETVMHCWASRAFQIITYRMPSFPA